MYLELHAYPNISFTDKSVYARHLHGLYAGSMVKWKSREEKREGEKWEATYCIFWGSKCAFQIEPSHTRMHTHTHARARTDAHTKTHTETHTLTCTRTHAHACTRKHTDTHTYIHARACTPSLTHTHTHTHRAKLKWGLGHKSLKTTYEGALVPLTTYGAPVWEEAVKK